MLKCLSLGKECIRQNCGLLTFKSLLFLLFPKTVNVTVSPQCKFI